MAGTASGASTDLPAAVGFMIPSSFGFAGGAVFRTCPSMRTATGERAGVDAVCRGRRAEEPGNAWSDGDRNAL